MTFKRFFPLLILLAIGLVGASLFLTYKRNRQGRVVSVYATKESCEEASRKECVFPVCGHIPKGHSFKEVCKVDFRQGWITVDDFSLHSDKLSTAFSSKEACEQATGKACIFKDCSPKTRDETCGEDYKKGWRPVGKALVTGRIIHKSDVQTIPDRAVNRGEILVIPTNKFSHFLIKAKLAEKYDEGNIWHFQAGVSDEIVSKFTVASSPLSFGGRFSIDLEEGEYLFCLTNTRDRSPGESDWIFQGCLTAKAQGGQKTELDITSAFGGISLN